MSGRSDDDLLDPEDERSALQIRHEALRRTFKERAAATDAFLTRLSEPAERSDGRRGWDFGAAPTREPTLGADSTVLRRQLASGQHERRQRPDNLPAS